MTKTIVNVTHSALEIELDPAWNRARELLAHGRGLAAQLAEEILRLRAEYGQGHGGARRSSSQVVNLIEQKGFVAQLRAQLGLHPQQAARLIESAQHTHVLALVADAEDGEDVLLDAASGERLTVDTTARELAREACNAIAAHSLTPGRAWAGFQGGLATKGTPEEPKARAPIDHHRNLVRAVKALATSLEHWRHLTPQQRAEVEHYWAQMNQAGLFPDTFGVTS